MVAHDAVDYVGSAVQDYVQHRDEASRKCLEQAIQGTGILNDKEELAELNRQLEASGLLPKLLQQEISNIDTWHVSINPFSDITSGGANRKLERSEMQDVVDNASDYRGTTVLAAQFGLEAYDRIKASGDFGQHYLSYGISSDMIDSYMRKQEDDGKIVSADQFFSGDTEESKYGYRTAGSFGRAPHHLGQADADLPEGYAMMNGKAVYMGDNDSYAGYDYSSDEKRWNGGSSEDTYQFGNREVQREKNGSWAYTVKAGDTMDRVSRAILRDQLGYEPQEEDVQNMSRRMAEANKVHDRNIIRIGQKLVIPDQWQ